MKETSKDYRYSPDRLELLWLLLKKKGIDFEPQQFPPPENATGQMKKESEPASAQQSQQDSLSNNRGSA